MKATLTLDFSDKLSPDEQRELLEETMTRQIPIETVLIEALRMRRACLPQSPTPPPAIEAAMAA